MRRTLLALPLALMIAGALPTRAAAQESKKARGTVTAMSANSITVSVAGSPTSFTVDEKTRVEATGAGTASRRAEAAGKPGPKLSEVIKTGQNVEVTYQETGGTKHASVIRRVASAGSAATTGSASSASSAPKEPTSASGKVTAVAADSLTISSSTGTQTYLIDATTRVVGKGAGTATRAGGGRAPITAMIASGDTVDVRFKKVGDKMHATSITVTMKGKP